MSQTYQTIEMHAAPPAEVESSLISPDAGMLILTWITFFLLLAVLYKFAWNPILKALDDREALIRKSLADADRIREEMGKIHQTHGRLILEAENKGKDIVEKARQAAAEASRTIENKAKEEVQILLDNARRDIKEETEKAQQILREQSAQIAVDLAGKLIEENLDDKKNRELITKFLKEI